MSEFSYYKVLHINRTATIEDINKAYRKLSLKYHPTKNASLKSFSVCSDQFHQICEAYEVLSDFKSRTVYDKYGPEILSRGLQGVTESSYSGYKYKRNAFEVSFHCLKSRFLKNSIGNIFLIMRSLTIQAKTCMVADSAMPMEEYLIKKKTRFKLTMCMSPLNALLRNYTWDA
jgi:DnaJ-class molecular chaperone